MSIQYRVVKLKASPKLGGKEKYYPVPVARGKSDLRNIVDAIAVRSTVSSADSIATLEGLIQVIPELLGYGDIVNLGEFGSFRISFRSEGEDKEEEVCASNVKELKIIFRPGAKLLEALKKMKVSKEVKR